jgi:hypothetical protein
MRPAPQLNLTLHEPGDQLEQEVDRVAEQVLATEGPGTGLARGISGASIHVLGGGAAPPPPRPTTSSTPQGWAK